MKKRLPTLVVILFCGTCVSFFAQPLCATILSYGPDDEGRIDFEEDTAIFDIDAQVGSFAWRDGVTSSPSNANNKMHLSAGNILTLYKANGFNEGLVFNPETGRITLQGSAAGIFFGSNTLPTISVGTGGKAVFGSGLEVSSGQLAITATTAAISSTSGALVVSGGIGVAKDSWINGIRVGRGNNDIATSTAVGFGTLANNGTVTPANSGVANSAFGYNALTANTSGYENLAVGTKSLESNIVGYQNAAAGSFALFSNTGSTNTGMGRGTLYFKTAGHDNTALGANAGMLQSNGSNLTTTSSSIYIGANSRGFSNSDSNSIVIGTAAVGAGANTTVIGNAATQFTYLKGKIMSPSIEVAGAAKFKGVSEFEGQVILSAPQGDISMGEFE